MEVGALKIEAVPVDDECIGERWTTLNREQLTKLVGLVALGQATRASLVIDQLAETAPEFTDDGLIDEAIIMLSVQEVASKPRTGYPRVQRDGFIFEVISWVAAHQELGSRGLLKDPHIRATTQGLDGLLIELNAASDAITRSVIFEDKCTDDPRATFGGKVIPAFKERHSNKRSAEIVAATSLLIQTAGLGKAVASNLSKDALRLDLRSYRAAFVVTCDLDSEDARSKIFDRYIEIDGITPTQRIAATFVTEGGVRDWFDGFAAEAVAYLASLKVEVKDV